MKLLSVQSELRALRSICDGDTKTASKLMSVLQQSHFQYPPAAEAFKIVKRQAKANGEFPEWSTLCNEPTLEVSTRRALKGANVEMVPAAKTASIVGILERYRKLRVLLEAGRSIMDSLGGEKANPDELIEQTANALTNARINTESKQTMYHIGKGNNSTQLLKELLYGKKPPMVKTGYQAYDERNGGFLRGSLVLIGANTGGGKCLVGTSMVPTSMGLLSLGELREPTDAVGFSPLKVSVYGKHGVEETDATYMTNGTTFSIETEQGDFIEGLPDHKLLTPNGFVRLDSLKIGDKVLKPVATKIFARKPCMYHGHFRFTPGVLTMMAHAFRSSNPPKEFAECAYGVPKSIRTTKQVYQEIFCHAVLNDTSMESKSHKKLLQFKALCDNLGIRVIIEYCKRGPKSHKPAYILKRFIGTLDMAKGTLDRVHPEPSFWVRVTKNAPGTQQVVYDLSVPKSRSYCAQGIIGHNTSMAVNLLKNMAEFYANNCALVSLEMSAEQMLARLQAILTGIELQKITLHRLDADEKKRIAAAYKKFAVSLKNNDTRFTIHTPETAKLEELLYSLQPFGYDVILIDYVSLLDGSGSTGEAAQWEKLGAITKFAKRYAERTGIVVILLVQVTAEGLVRYSRTMIEDANHVWVWTATKEESETVIYDIAQLKARNLQLFNFQLSSNSVTGKITDVDATQLSQTDEEVENEPKQYMVDINDQSDDS